MKLANIVKKLKDKKVKVTPQRIAVIEFLENNPIHPTADEIYNAVSKKLPTISLATVYNTLDMLEEIDEIYKLQFSAENKGNYEYNTEPHIHFYCVKCTKIYDIWEGVACNKLKELDGHKIFEKQCYFSGICRECLKKS